MSKNCLVTKLNGVVDNNTLPELGITKFVFKQGSGIDTEDYILLKTGDKAMTLETNGTLEGQIAREIPANSTVSGHLRKTATPEGTTYLKMDPYNVKALQIKGLKEVMDTNYLFRNIEFAYGYTPIIDKAIKENHNLIGLQLFNDETISINTIETIINNNKEHIKVLTMNTSIDNFGLSKEHVAKMQKIQHCSYRDDVAYLPATIRNVYATAQKPLFGEIVDMVVNQRGNGRTTGVIRFSIWAVSFPNLTYNGQVLKDYFPEIDLNIRDYFYVKWDDNDISFSNTKPAEYVAPETINNYTTD